MLAVLSFAGMSLADLLIAVVIVAAAVALVFVAPAAIRHYHPPVGGAGFLDRGRGRDGDLLHPIGPVALSLASIATIGLMMRITSVRVDQWGEPDTQVIAYTTVTLDKQLALHNLKILQDPAGRRMAMPSNHRHDACPKCKGPTRLDHRFCGFCGERLQEERFTRDQYGRPKLLYVDVAHPINAAFRAELEEAVFHAVDTSPCPVPRKGA